MQYERIQLGTYRVDSNDGWLAALESYAREINLGPIGPQELSQTGGFPESYPAVLNVFVNLSGGQIMLQVHTVSARKLKRHLPSDGVSERIGLWLQRAFRARGEDQ